MSTVEYNKMDFFELGDKTALICSDPSSADAARSALRDLGFKFHVADTAESAIERTRYTQYNCIVLHENFAGSSLRSNVFLNYFSTLPMAQRRNSFVCLIGPSFKTLDAMQAFAQSVHQVINPRDLANLTAILRKGLAEFDGLYHVYRSILELPQKT